MATLSRALAGKEQQTRAQATRAGAATADPFDDRPQARGLAAYAGELIGTLLFVFFITAVVSLYVALPTPQSPVAPFIDWSVIGLVHLLLLFALIQVFSQISGAHFNPAVTAALAFAREIGVRDAAIFVVMQLIGGIGGAFLTKALLKDEGSDVNYGALALSSRIDEKLFTGMVIEAIGTFFLVLVIFGVAVNWQGLKDWAGLAIGGALGMLVMVFGPVTGAGFNPARAFGPALAGEFGGADDFLVAYVLGPLVGALLAAVVALTLLDLRGKREPGGAEPVG